MLSVYVGMIVVIVIAVIISGSLWSLWASSSVVVTLIALSLRSSDPAMHEPFFYLCINAGIIVIMYRTDDAWSVILLLLIPIIAVIENLRTS
jgi:hypothetical protein